MIPGCVKHFTRNVDFIQVDESCLSKYPLDEVIRLALKWWPFPWISSESVFKIWEYQLPLQAISSIMNSGIKPWKRKLILHDISSPNWLRLWLCYVLEFIDPGSIGICRLTIAIYTNSGHSTCVYDIPVRTVTQQCLKGLVYRQRKRVPFQYINTISSVWEISWSKQDRLTTILPLWWEFIFHEKRSLYWNWNNYRRALGSQSQHQFPTGEAGITITSHERHGISSHRQVDCLFHSI